MRVSFGIALQYSMVLALSLGSLNCARGISGSTPSDATENVNRGQQTQAAASESATATATSTATSNPGGDDDASSTDEIAPNIDLDSMQDVEKIKFFAAISDAAYCGDGASCNFGDRINRSKGELAFGFDMSSWKMNLLTARDGQKDVEGYLFSKPGSNDVIIAFRGSESPESMGSFQDWMNDLDFAPQHFGGKTFGGEVHRGFLSNLFGIWHPNDTGLIKVLTSENLSNKRFWLTGHSLGGAIATLVGMKLRDEGKTVSGIYTYGSPKLAKWNFQGSFNSQLKSVTRNFVQDRDPVPHLGMGFHAVGETYAIRGRQLQLVEKDGLWDWDLITAFSQGDSTTHLIGVENPNSYLSALRNIR